MPSKPPFFEQERRDSCALARLRMLPAQHGANVSEADLLQEVGPLIGGLPSKNWCNWLSDTAFTPRSVNWIRANSRN
jgi:ABC-type bacteriocin/lantibiotic exporter with double-glycine peptidase domain